VVRTATFSEVIDRLVALHPSLRLRLVEDLKRFNDWRNAEIHTSVHSFESQGENRWLPLATTGIEHLCDVLAIQETSILSKEITVKSAEYQKQSRDALSALVDNVMRTARIKWNELPVDERTARINAAKNTTAFEAVSCPVCFSELRLIPNQNPIDSTVRQIKEGIERQSVYSLKRVRCDACGFALRNSEEISAALLAEEVVSREVLDWDQIFELGYVEEYGDE
jgi:hypothetical protein